MHQSTYISLYDDEDDLELHDVTKELENLKAVFSRYDNHAVKLQNELELVREDLYGLIHARGTKPDNEDNIKPNEIKLTQEDFETIKLINERQAKKMLSLKKKAHTYKSNFNVLLQEMDKQKNLLEDCKKNDMITVEKSVQTDLAEPLSIETSQIRPLTLDKFTHGVLEIAFQLHEKLSECHGRRRLEIIHHEKHTSELSRNHLEALKRVQEKQQKNLTEFKYRIQKATQQELGVLREEREKLLSQLNEIRKSEQQTRHTNSLLKLEIHNLEKKLNGYEAKVHS